ncbi:hypothetical protein NC652_018894 [Populus alba x Populus x berolinensis]|nr:hypothetical protein NC652_018894 [Populus alba x Populus x berolinensis]
MAYLQQFHLMIKYKKGSHNKLADMLSRPPVTALCLSVFMQVQPTLHEEYIDWYKEDPDFQKALAEFAINHTLHSSTNKSLSEVCSGFSPQSPFDLEFTIESTSQLEKGEGDRIRAQRFVDQIRKIHHKVEQQLQKAQQKYKERHDRHHKQGNFQEGDLVWLHLGKDRLLGEGKKLRPIRCGPFKIIRKIGDNACQLELPAFIEMYSVVNVEKLKLFEPSMLDDEPNGTLPTVEDLVTEKEVILSWRGKQLPPDVAQGNPSGSEEKANVQVRQNGSHGKLDKLSFLVSNSRTSRSWLVLAREAMIWDDRWLTPGLLAF